MRTRPRRLLLVAVAISLCAGLLLAIQVPLQAQDSGGVAFHLPGGDAQVSGQQIAQGEQQTFTLGKSKKRVTLNGVTLTQALTLAEQQRGQPISGVGVYGLWRDARGQGLPIYLTEQPDQLFFFVQGGVVKWFLHDPQNRVTDRGSAAVVDMDGLEGALLKVGITKPDKIEAETEVEFKATASGEEPGEQLSYRWFVDGTETVAGRGDTFKHTFKKVGSHTVYVEVRGTGNSRGVAQETIDVGKKTAPPNTGSGGGSSPGSGGTSPGGGSGGGGSGGGGAFNPTPAPPSTPALPPPSSSPPPSNPGRGPNLAPSAPGTTTPPGRRVEGILVSANVPPKSGQTRAEQTRRADQRQANKKNDTIDWKLAGGISLASLLVILGAVRERAHIQRLLPRLS